jgi:hypothetical protein
MSKPTVGRIVHYVPLAGERSHNHTQCFAALVTHVWSDTCVSLAVFNENGAPLHAKTSIMLTEVAQPGQCEWPKIIKEN